MKYSKRNSKGQFSSTGKTYKPKVTKKKMVTLINYVLDQSGSMQSQKSNVISGFNEYLSSLRVKKNEEILISLMLFDTNGGRIRIVRPAVFTNVLNCAPLNGSTYIPCGGTPLYDALAQSIEDIDSRITDSGIRISRVLTVVHTDGQENESRSFDKASIRRLIQEKENTGFWTFLYMGAAETTWNDASSIGFHKNNTIAYQPIETKGIFRSLGNSTLNYAASSNLQSSTVFGGGLKYVGNKAIDADKRFQHLSSDGYTKYEAVKWQDNTWSCNCPGWATRKTCKHIGGGISAIASKV